MTQKSVRMCVCLCVCVSLASDFSGTIEVIIVKLGTVNASDMVMHHVLIILTLTFIQYLSYGIQTWHDGRLMHCMYARAHFDDLDLIARSW